MIEEEIAHFADAGVSIAHCPNSNLKLASGIADITRYREAGLNVALGTDGAASNNLLDLFSEMRTAALLAKAKANDASAITASEALHMATLSGAEALGLERSIGSIETGKLADLACVDLSSLNSQPVYDVVSQIVYAVRANQVADVWVGGRHQLDNGEFTHIDTDGVFARCNEWRERIATTGEIL
jgi:5-methylthioadenosine/S-adenosylhomocysteine deaminase